MEILGLTNLRPLLFWLAMPLALPQGLHLRRTALRLPAASGERCGVVGSGVSRRLLAIGDSIVAGVGIETMQDAMPAQYARALADSFACRVHWHAVDLNGADCGQLIANALPLLPDEPFDHVFISVGVNDVTRLTSTRSWARNLRTLLEHLREHSPDASIVLAGVPPMRRFPALSGLLRQLFGQRAERLDAIAAALAASLPGVWHFPTPVPDDPAAFAEDGFHPCALACEVWARGLVEALRETDKRSKQL